MPNPLSNPGDTATLAAALVEAEAERDRLREVVKELRVRLAETERHIDFLLLKAANLSGAVHTMDEVKHSNRAALTNSEGLVE